MEVECGGWSGDLGRAESLPVRKGRSMSWDGTDLSSCVSSVVMVKMRGFGGGQGTSGSMLARQPL